MKLTLDEKKLQHYLDDTIISNIQKGKSTKRSTISQMQDIAHKQIVRMKKNKQITMRINEQDLQLIKKKAAALGLPYQTYIASHLHQLANNK